MVYGANLCRKKILRHTFSEMSFMSYETKTISKKKRIILQTIHLKYNNGTNKENESHSTKETKKDGCKRKIG